MLSVHSAQRTNNAYTTHTLRNITYMEANDDAHTFALEQPQIYA